MVMAVKDPACPDAMQQVLDNVPEEQPPPSGGGEGGAKDIDLLFLRGIMESPTNQEQEDEVRLEAVQDNNVELVSDILGDIKQLRTKDQSAEELSRILQEPHFQSLLEAHDMVASKCYEVPPPAEMTNDAAVNSALMQADAVRMIGIRKKAGEPLGVTFRVDKDELVIARILHRGMIDRQGLLHVGDIIKEVNGKDVGNNPTELQDMLKECSGSITLKILPSYRDAPAPPQVYVRPYFDYDPAHDSLIPCREAGVAFSRGDILQIVNREDPNWWQACHVVGGATGLVPSQFLEEKRKAFVPRDFEGSGQCGVSYVSVGVSYFADDTTVVGLISNNDEMAYRKEVQHLAEWCAANNLALNTKKTKELMVDFRKKSCTHTPILIDGTEVERVTSFKFLGVHISEDLSWSLNTSTLVKKAHQRLFFLRRLKKAHLSLLFLVNFYRCTIESILTNCVSIKQSLNCVVLWSDTSRRPRDDELDGNSYHFTSRTEMELDVRAGRFLEHGEYEGNLYGTKIESIHQVVATGRTCILDVNPQALKLLRTSEFMPLVVLVAAPDLDTLRVMHTAVVEAGLSTKQLTDVDLKKTVDESARIQRTYSHYFDLTITNDNLDRAFEALQVTVEKLTSEQQWVPISWVY
ncbi:MAGUK p55 subfamily member 6b [Eucyclogobius newberryi]|uniref:MAGUK p55 subfamily member 6b n=1 Tax=Eucyclogobius newberryi TaxID=166745 RepID=UPI003B5B0C1E